ncbi:MAG: hypothetical protein HC932_06225 [Thermales bacterium]|nr:hypothetical protein [Thermales bacterium]
MSLQIRLMQFSNQPNLTPKEQAYDDLDGLLESNIVDKLTLQVDICSSTDTEIRISKIKHFCPRIILNQVWIMCLFWRIYLERS